MAKVALAHTGLATNAVKLRPAEIIHELFSIHGGSVSYPLEIANTQSDTENA
jgi:hypothetical protein